MNASVAPAGASELPFARRARLWIDELRPSERRVVQHLLALDPAAPEATAAGIAATLGVSQATVVNAVQHLGYAGFADFRRRWIAERAVEQAHRQMAPAGSPSQEEADPLVALCRRIFEEDAAAIALTGRLLDRNAFRRAVELLEAAPEVLCVGAGWSGVLARLAAGTFTKYGIRATGEELAIEQLALAEVADVRTLVLALSHRGRDPSLLAVVERARQRRLTVVALTHRATSPLARAASLALVCAAPSLPDERHPNQTGGPATYLTLVRALAEAVAWRRTHWPAPASL